LQEQQRDDGENAFSLRCIVFLLRKLSDRLVSLSCTALCVQSEDWDKLNSLYAVGL
jgi:hypothetical protein